MKILTLYLFVIKLCGEVSRDRLDDVPHGEGACAEHGPDGVPVSLKVSPGQEGPSGIVCHRAQHGAHVLTADLGLVQSHPQVTGNSANVKITISIVLEMFAA